MDKITIEKIIDELTKDNKKLRTKQLTDDEAIFVHFGAVKFLCDFETGPLITKGHLYDHIEFWSMPENEDEFKTLLEKVLNKYS